MHDNDITAVAVWRKDRKVVATGQFGKRPRIIVWNT